ncbi:hypothetical protein [Paracoccus sp. (in: a-proteobacteria)]|uniref:hypothetical protein n=1 Tax=Paracoccus sp. TaxID=267 RepID=UPI003A85579B
MQPALRQSLIAGAALMGLALLVGCTEEPVQETPAISRPAPKPGELTVATTRGGQLGRARISTKSGEILILEPDGQVTTMELDSPEGRDAFAVSEADLMALNANLNLQLPGVAAEVKPRRKTAQEKALEEFAARTQPALPVWREGTEIDPEVFVAARVVPLGEGKDIDLVEVTANMRNEVDADVAFSYATCALAGWAKASGVQYGRHIRTLQDKRDGKLAISAAFTVSKTKPLGLRVMETNETLQACKERGIPAA